MHGMMLHIPNTAGKYRKGSVDPNDLHSSTRHAVLREHTPDREGTPGFINQGRMR